MGFFFVNVISIINLLGTLKDYEFMILLHVFLVVMYLAMQVSVCKNQFSHNVLLVLVHFLPNVIEWVFVCRVVLCSLEQEKRIAISDNWGDRLLHYTMKAIQSTP